MATLAERILIELAAGDLDDDELAGRLGVRRQAVNQACRYLEQQGRLKRIGGVGFKIRNRASASTRGPLVGPSTAAVARPAVRPTRSITNVTSGAEFEMHARAALSEAWGVQLTSRVVTLRGGVTHSFDLVSRDESVLGDAKRFKDLKPSPAAKLSVIAEYVWLLQNHQGASRRFLVFGQDRAVPERWLSRFAPLLDGVEFWFLDGNGLDRLA
jgi:DNA-binding GntR family transcriptional regulator